MNSDKPLLLWPGSELSGPLHGRGSPQYSPDEVIARFDEVLDALELKEGITRMHLGLDGLFRRGNSLREFTSLCVALWMLALESSFPGFSQDYYSPYLSRSQRLGGKSSRRKYQNRIRAYAEVLAPKGNSDFTPVAEFMIPRLKVKNKDMKTIALTLSLEIRRLYQVIFDHLIL